MPDAAKNEERAAREVPGLLAARRRASLSLRDLEKRSGVSFVNISRIENGQAAMPDTIDKLAGALGVEVEELLGPPEWIPWNESAMTALVRQLGLEPEPYFTEKAIGNRKVRDLYEATYVRLLLAEQRARRQRLFDAEPFDTELTDYVRRLLAVARRLPPRGEGRELQRRASKIAQRAAAVMRQEADRLELRVVDKRAEARTLMEEGGKLTGPE
jgi:transcriptional regulator with XRE-family HTH domain